LYELLRKDPATRKIPMILITGYAQKFGAWDSEKNVGYFQKPISMHDILYEVKKRLKITSSIADVRRKATTRKTR